MYGRRRHLNAKFADEGIEPEDPFFDVTCQGAESLCVGVHENLAGVECVRFRDSYGHVGEDFSLTGQDDIATHFILGE